MFSVEVQGKVNPIIKVIGVGGGGCNAITHMSTVGINSVELIAANTDSQALQKVQATKKIKLGKNSLGAGGNPEEGRKAAEESEEQIKSAISGANLLFIAAGMGGGTGTGASPVVAAVAKQLKTTERNVMIISVVTKPFEWEGEPRSAIADQGIAELKKYSDVVIVVPNDKVLELAGDDDEVDISVIEAFKMVDDVLSDAVSSISELITSIGSIINRDMADLERILSIKGDAHFGKGFFALTEDSKVAKIDRAKKAAEIAINSPLLETSIDGAQAILINIVGPIDLGLKESSRAVEMIRERLGNRPEIFYGTSMNENTDGVTVTIFATGLNGNKEGLTPRRVGFATLDDSIPTPPRGPARTPATQTAGGSVEYRPDLDMPTFLSGKGGKKKK